MIRYL